MHAVVLAAGGSTRLRPLTETLPKCLVPVAGAPILRRELDTLVAAGVDRVTFVTGYREAQVRDAVTSWHPDLRVDFVLNRDWATTNNAASLLLAGPVVAGMPFLLLDSDIVFARPVLDRVIGREDSLALRPADDLGAEEIKVEMEADGRVLRIGKDVVPARAAGESIGIERFSATTSAALFEHLRDRVEKRGLVNEWYEASFQQMIEAGVPLYAVSVGDAYCAEIDTVDDLRRVERELVARGM